MYRQTPESVKKFYTLVNFVDTKGRFHDFNANFTAKQSGMTMAKEGTLLIVDDNRSILAALRLLLEKYFARVLTLPTPNRLATTLREEQIDVILLDMNFTAGINTGNAGRISKSCSSRRTPISTWP